MKTTIECPCCGDQVEVEDPEVGKEVTCAGCEEVLTVTKDGDNFTFEVPVDEDEDEAEDGEEDLDEEEEDEEEEEEKA